jgi:hypothetical protein
MAQAPIERCDQYGWVLSFVHRSKFQKNQSIQAVKKSTDFKPFGYIRAFLIQILGYEKIQNQLVAPRFFTAHRRHDCAGELQSFQT